MPVTDSYTSKPAGTIAGFMLLITLFIPFGIASDAAPIWSWDLLAYRGGAPLGVVVFLMAAWMIGLFVLLFSASLISLPLSICYLVLGIGLVVLFFVLAPFGVLAGVPRIPWPVILVLIATGAFLIVTGVRVRLGGNALICLLQIATGVAVIVAAGILLYREITVATKLPPDAPATARCNAIIWLVTQGLLMFCGVLGLLHGLMFRSPGVGLSRAARTLTGIVLLGLLLYGLIGLQVLADAPDRFFPHLLRMLNPVIITLGMAIVVLEGLTSLFSEIGARAGRRDGAGEMR